MKLERYRNLNTFISAQGGEMITRIQNYGLQDIENSIRYLLEKSSNSEEVRQLAIEIAAGKEDPIAAVYDWVKGNVAYVSDPIDVEGDVIELFISPVRMVKNYRKGKTIAGDCDDMALTTTALLQAVGIKSRVVLLDMAGGGLDHAICEAYSEKLDKWVMIDASATMPLGWEETHVQKLVI